MSFSAFQTEYTETVKRVNDGITKIKPLDSTPQERKQIKDLLTRMIELLDLSERVSQMFESAMTPVKPSGATDETVTATGNRTVKVTPTADGPVKF